MRLLGQSGFDRWSLLGQSGFDRWSLLGQSVFDRWSLLGQSAFDRWSRTVGVVHFRLATTFVFFIDFDFDTIFETTLTYILSHIYNIGHPFLY